MITIQIINGSVCAVDKKDSKHIKSAIAYKDEILITVTKGRRKVKEKRLITKYAWAYKSEDVWFFWRGDLRGVLATLKKKGITYTIEGNRSVLPVLAPSMAGIELRDYQTELVNIATKNKRGVIQAVTGSGKSAVISGIMSAYRPAKCLVITHLVDLVLQLKENFEVHLGEPVTQLSSHQPQSSTRINVVTIQTLARMSPDMYMDEYDVVICDECHMVSSLHEDKKKPMPQYARVFSQIQTPHRFGFTATTETKPSAQKALVSLIGPILHKLDINKASDMKIVSKPKIVLLKMEKNVSHTNIMTYKDAIKLNVVQNSAKNRLIIECAQKLNAKGLSTLILISQVAHGNFLQDKARSLGLNAPFVYQDTSADVRVSTKKQLNNKEIMTCIASNIWKVAIDIPTLDSIIIAGGGKSQVQLIQSIGRGLRKTKDKNEVVIVDIFDNSCRWIASHFAERLTIYFEMGWLGCTIDDL